MQEIDRRFLSGLPADKRAAIIHEFAGDTDLPPEGMVAFMASLIGLATDHDRAGKVRELRRHRR
jgi:hypothetical protein